MCWHTTQPDYDSFLQKLMSNSAASSEIITSVVYWIEDLIKNGLWMVPDVLKLTKMYVAIVFLIHEYH